MKLITLVTLLVLSSNLFADYGVARIWHLTQRTDKEVCAITVVKFTSGKYKVETNCYVK